MISTLENEVYEDESFNNFYDKKDEFNESYKILLNNGCKSSLTGFHTLTKNEYCNICSHLSNFQNIINNLPKDISCGKKGKVDRGDHDYRPTNLMDFVEGKDSKQNYTTKIYDLGKKIYNELKGKGKKFNNLSDAIFESIPKDMNLMNTEYYDLFQIVMSFFQNDADGKTFNMNYHPLIRLINEAGKYETINNFLQVISNLSKEYKMSDFHTRVKFQSLEYKNLANLKDTYIHFNSSKAINTFLFTLAACKLPYFEDVSIKSSTDKLILQLYNRKKVLGSDNFALAISRYANIENEIKNMNIEKIADNELKRVNAHLLFKKIVLNVRSGNFNIDDSKQLESFIGGIKTLDMNLQFNISEEENFIRSFFSIFGYNSILIRKNKIENGIFPLKAVPILPLNVTQKLGTVDTPIKLITDMNMIINFDALVNKIQITPTYKNMNTVSETNLTSMLNTITNPSTNTIYYDAFQNTQVTPLIINGTIIYTVNRIQTDLLNNYSLGELSDLYSKKISTEYVEFDKSISINLKEYILQAVICYRTEDTFFGEETILTSKYSNSVGFIAYIRTEEDDWFVYDDCMTLTTKSKNIYLENLLERYYSEKGITRPFADWKVESEALNLINNFNDNKYHYYSFIKSFDEIKEKISRYGYMYIYSMDYDEYISSSGGSSIMK